jgi:hypothetical protein
MSSFALTTSTRNWRRPPVRAIAFLAASVLALGVGHDLLHMPLQIGDSLAPLLDAVRASSPWSEFTAHLREDGYFRPMRLATIKLVSDLANGHYFLGYRLFHALLVLAFLLLFVRALEVRDRLALAVVPLALTVFVGIHTFLGTVKEIYPTNHFLQIAVLALLALNLAQSRGGLLVDLLLLVTFTVAALTLESGLLVWVVVIAAWISGMPGVSRRSAAGVTALLAGYFVLRFGIFGTGLPTVEERSTGFLLEALDPPQIRERFGDNLLPLYAYNVASSISSVLFSEPRSGVWVFVRAIRGGEIAPRHFIQIGASLFATGLLLAYVVARLRSGVRRPATLADRHTMIFALVLAANAAMSYVYTKDEIMSTAGAFYALAVTGAAVYFLRTWAWPERARSWQATAAVCILCLAGSAAWAVRAAGVHHVLRSQAFVQRNDWTRLDREWSRDGNWARYRDQEALVRQLQREAIATRVVNPRFEPRWMQRVFDINY